MSTTPDVFWNNRYSKNEFAYGETPNVYLKHKLKKIKNGRILFPAEGEGRNAVYAAKLGWEVFAFDISIEGQKKADRLAKMHQVEIDYQVAEFNGLTYREEEFDAIALIYAHFPPDQRSLYFRQLDQYLRKNGVIIFEAFSKNNLSYLAKSEKIGGPRDINFLYSIEEIKADFPNYSFIELTETEVDLNEGCYHIGLGSVVRFLAEKL